MKRLLFLLLLAAFGFSACKEEPVPIPDFSSGERRVLIEELTGIQCAVCPKGTRELLRLQDIFGKDSLIIVSIHAASGFTSPISNPPSQYNFTTAQALELGTLLGSADGFPAAAINRKQVDPGSPSLMVTPFTSWAGIIGAEFQKSYGLDLLLENHYEPASRKLDMKITLGANNTLPGENRLTILITQDSIVDPQKDGTEIVSAYIHRHVMRGIVTATAGDPIPEALNKGSVVEKNYSFTLPAEWVAEHCSVVAYVHHGPVPDREVLQAIEKHVVE
jgi:hypothetical protein